MPTKKSNKPNREQLRNLAKLSGIGVQMAATVFLFAYAGKWLDDKYPAEKKWFTLIFTLLGVGLSLYNVLKQVNKINDTKS